MRFGILGPLRVVGDDGREVALGGRMPRALLVVLLLRPNEVVASGRLVEELWAGEPPPSGTKGLQVHVSRLRHALVAGRSDPSDEQLVTTAGGYLLKIGPDELDADRCERLCLRPGRWSRQAGSSSHSQSSARRSSCGAARSCPTSSTTHSPRRRSPGSASCGLPRFRNGSPSR